MAEENLPGPGLAISDKGGLCRVFSPAAPIFVVQGTVVGTARQNISMVGCCRLPFGTASRSVRVLLKVPYLQYFSPLPRPSLDEKTRSITVPVVVPASRSEGALRRTRSTPSPDLAAGPPRRSPPRQSPLAGSSPSAASAMHKTTGAYSVLLTEHLYRLPTLLLTGNQLAAVLPSLRHPLLVALATTMRPSTPCGLVVFIGCLPCIRRFLLQTLGNRTAPIMMSPN